MDFWGYPSDLCLFADNPQNPVTDDEEQDKIKKTRHLIFYILVFFYFYLISTAVTCYKCRNKIQESNNKNLFF
jgi:hypothetical protein